MECDDSRSSRVQDTEGSVIVHHASRPPTIALSFALMAVSPGDNEEKAAELAGFLEDSPNMHSIENPSGWHTGPKWTDEGLHTFLRQLREAKPESKIQSISLTLESPTKDIATYAKSAVVLKELFQFGPEAVRSLTYRRGDQSGPTDGAFLSSPTFADGLDTLRLSVRRGDIPEMISISKSLKVLEFIYTMTNLPEVHHVNALANCIGASDLNGSLTVRIVCSDSWFETASNTTSLNRKLEEHRVTREERYNGKLQDGSYQARIEDVSDEKPS
jgi:hypothetical protein